MDLSEVSDQINGVFFSEDFGYEVFFGENDASIPSQPTSPYVVVQIEGDIENYLTGTIEGADMDLYLAVKVYGGETFADHLSAAASMLERLNSNKNVNIANVPELFGTSKSSSGALKTEFSGVFYL